MTQDPSNVSPDRPSARSPPLLVPGTRSVLYGFVAAGGFLALLNGIRNYQEFANGGGGDGILLLLAIVVILGVGFTLLFVALAATVAMGIDHAKSA